MTFKLDVRYPGRAYAADAENPRGRFKNRTSATSEDGTYLEEDWKNDERAFTDAILLGAGVEPNGNVDTPANSQVYEALMLIVQKMINKGTEHLYGRASGGSDAITTTLNRAIKLEDGVIIYVRAQYSNTTTAPTLKVGDLSVKAIVKGNNLPLKIGDIPGAGYVMQLTFDQNFDRWILLNPATGVIVPQSIPVGTIAYMGRNDNIDGWLKIDNQEHQRSRYPNLVSQCPQFIQAGSSPDTFRLIDLRGYFLRTLDNGKGVDTGRGFGSQQGDAIRNIWGSFPATNRDGRGGPVNGAFRQVGNWSTNYRDGGGDAWGIKIDFNAANQVPTAGENRPKNYALPLYIKY